MVPLRPCEKRDVFALPRLAIATESTALMRILDRYVLRSFFEPFLLCFLGFLGILTIFDLYDNRNDFIEGSSRLWLIGIYYLNQLPHFILLSMPMGVLLALLYLGVKGIRLGPTLPEFLTPNVAAAIVEKFDLKGISTVEADVEAMMAGM